MNLLIASGFLGLGHAPSSLGVTLSEIITFVLIIGGAANFLIGHAFKQVMAERRQNIRRRREYEERMAAKQQLTRP